MAIGTAAEEGAKIEHNGATAKPAGGDQPSAASYRFSCADVQTAAPL